MTSNPFDKFNAARAAAQNKEAQRKEDIGRFFLKLQEKHAQTRDERLTRTLDRIKHKKAEPDLPRVKPAYRLSPESKETWNANASKRVNDPGRQQARDARFAFEKKERAAGRGPSTKDYLERDFMKGWNKIRAIKPGDLPDLD